MREGGRHLRNVEPLLIKAARSDPHKIACISQLRYTRAVIEQDIFVTLPKSNKYRLALSDTVIMPRVLDGPWI